MVNAKMGLAIPLPERQKERRENRGKESII